MTQGRSQSHIILWLWVMIEVFTHAGPQYATQHALPPAPPLSVPCIQTSNARARGQTRTTIPASENTSGYASSVAHLQQWVPGEGIPAEASPAGRAPSASIPVLVYGDICSRTVQTGAREWEVFCVEACGVLCGIMLADCYLGGDSGRLHQARVRRAEEQGCADCEVRLVEVFQGSVDCMRGFRVMKTGGCC